MNFFCLDGSIWRTKGGARAQGDELAYCLQRVTRFLEELFTCVTRPDQGRYEERADDSDEDLLRSVEADLLRLGRIRDPIGSDSKRSEPEQKIGIRHLACTDLPELVASESHHKEKDWQKDRWRRSIVADQPDANEGSGNGAGHSHDRFEGERAHELLVHQHYHGEHGPVLTWQSQRLRAKQSEQTC